MKHRVITIGLAALLLAWTNGCKRADQSGQRNTTASQGTSGPAGAANSKDGVLLNVKWPVGNRYVYRLDLDQQSVNHIPQLPNPIQQNFTMAMTYSVSVLGEAPQGGRNLELEFLANEMEIRMGGQTMASFDSKESPKGGPQDAIASPFRKMIGSKIRLETLADGRVSQVIGGKEWEQHIADETSGTPAQLLAQQFNEGFLRQICDFGRGSPDRPVRVGETWPFKVDMPMGSMGKVNLDAKATLKGFEDRDDRHCALTAIKATLKGTPAPAGGPGPKLSLESGKVTGTGWFDPELGALVESTSDQVLQVKGEMPGAPGGKSAAAPTFTCDIKQTVSIKLVESGKTTSTP